MNNKLSVGDIIELIAPISSMGELGYTSVGKKFTVELVEPQGITFKAPFGVGFASFDEVDKYFKKVTPPPMPSYLSNFLSNYVFDEDEDEKECCCECGCGCCDDDEDEEDVYKFVITDEKDVGIAASEMCDIIFGDYDKVTIEVTKTSVRITPSYDTSL